MDRRARNIGSLGWKCLPAVAVLALAGCSGPTPAQLALSCPKVNIIRDLAEVTQFRPGGNGPSDVVTRGLLADFFGNCDYTDDGVTVNVNLQLTAERGPAMQNDQANFRYFVTVVRPGEEMPAAKREFDTTVRFKPLEGQVNHTEELSPKIPLPVDQNAGDWNILVGFQLTPDQLDFNRALAARANPQSPPVLTPRK